MQAMYGKFPLANRPKMTRRKRKNVNLAPGASSTTSRGGNSPTTEPRNDSTGVSSGASSSTTQRQTAHLSASGPHRRTKSTHRARKRGGDHYDTWMPRNDYPSSPTTDETLPITPRSDVSSTFSVSPSPRPSFRQPRQSQPPVYGRRNAVSAGPDNTNFDLLPNSESQYFVPASTSAPLIPTHTWPMSTMEEARRYPEPTSNGLVHTQSDGAFYPLNQGFGQHTGAAHGQPVLGAPQIVFPCDPNQQSYLTSYTTSNYQPSHSLDSFSSTPIDPSLLADRAFDPRVFDQSTYPAGYASEQYLVTPGDDFSLGSPGSFTEFSDVLSTPYNGPYSNADETNRTNIFVPNAYVPSFTLDSSTDCQLQSTSPAPRGVAAQSPQEQFSLANLAFGPTRPSQ